MKLPTLGYSDRLPLLHQVHQWLCYVLLAGFFVGGFGFALLLPPFQAPDESAHWSTAVYRLDRLFTPKLSACTMTEALPEHFRMSEVSFQTTHSQPTGLYASLESLQPRCYQHGVTYGNILSYPSVALAKLFYPQAKGHSSAALLCFYTARMLGGLLLTLMLGRSLFLFHATSRTLGLGLTAFCLAPLVIQQSFAVTADLVINLFALSVVTAVVAGNRWRWVDLGLFLFLGVAAASTKPVIAPLALIPSIAAMRLRRLSDKTWGRTPQTLMAPAILVILAVCVYSGINARDLLVSPDPMMNAGLQLHVMIDSPGSSLLVLLRAVIGQMHLDSMIGPLGWLDTSVTRMAKGAWQNIFSGAVAIEWSLAVLYCLARLPSTRPWAWREAAKSGLHLLSMASLLLVFALSVAAVMYLAWTEVGSATVKGLQGRYFFPIYLVLLVLIPHFLAMPDRASALPTPKVAIDKAVAPFCLVVGIGATAVLGYLPALLQSLQIRFW